MDLSAKRDVLPNAADLRIFSYDRTVAVSLGVLATAVRHFENANLPHKFPFCASCGLTPTKRSDTLRLLPLSWSLGPRSGHAPLGSVTEGPTEFLSATLDPDTRGRRSSIST